MTIHRCVTLHRWTALGSGLLMAVLVAGCDPAAPAGTAASPTPASPAASTPPPPGLADLTAAQIMQKARAAMMAASGFRVKGSIPVSGDTLTLDVRLGTTGGQGRVGLSGAPVDVIVIGRTVYARPTQAYWRKTTPDSGSRTMIVRHYRGRWIKAPARNAEFGWFSEFAGPADAFTTSLFQTFDPTQTKTAPKAVDGVPCVGIDDGQQVLWVDVATARPVRIAQHAKPGSGIAFSRYGVVASPAQPAADQVTPVTNTFSG